MNETSEMPAPTLEGRLGRFAKLTEDKRALEAALRVVQDELNELEQPLLEDMALAGLESAKIGGFTVYRKQDFYCRAKPGIDKRELVQAFEDAGMSAAIGLQWQTMRSLWKEHAQQGLEFPPAIASRVEVGEMFKLCARKA